MRGTKLPAPARWALVLVTGAVAGALVGLIAVGMAAGITALLHVFGAHP